MFDYEVISLIEVFIISFLNEKKFNNRFEIFTPVGSFNNNIGYITFDNTKSKRIILDSSSLRTARIFRVLEICYKNIKNNTFITKRDLYYEDVLLFEKAQVIDSILSLITQLFAISREHLHVIASVKGLICGDISFINTKNQSIFHIKHAINGTSIYPLLSQCSQFKSSAKFLLLVEDEATYFQLVEYKFHIKYSCLLVTGKGYPDYNTRLLVKQVSLLNIPIFALFDCDPHGLEILTTYCIGSMNSFEENTRLIISNINWIGIKVEDITKYQLPKNYYIPLSKHDKNKIKNLLEKPWIINNIQWKTQLELIRANNYKIEIQILKTINQRTNFLIETYIPSKLKEYKII